MVLAAIFVQWYRTDEREAKRADRRADRDGDAELAAYNDYLARLADAAASEGRNRADPSSRS